MAQPLSPFASIAQFEQAKGMASMLAHAHIVPDHYRGEEHIGDCLIALEIAGRLGISVMAVMQNLNLVQGKPAWSAQFLISCLNATGRFSPLQYQMTGTPGQDDWGCMACASDRTGEIFKSPEVTIKMAKAEGWFDRPGSKWTTMPAVMLRYRSATLFTRMFAPEIAMGLHTAEEVMDTRSPDINGKNNRAHCKPRTTKPLFAQPLKAESTTANTPVAKASMIRERNGEPTPGQGASDPNHASSGTAPVTPSQPQYKFLRALTGLVSLSQHTEEEVMSFLRNTGKCSLNSTTLTDVMAGQPDAIIWAHDHWPALERELTELKKGSV